MSSGNTDAPVASTPAEAAEAVKQDATVYDITRPVRPARPHAASPEEMERHARFLAQIVDPVWTMGTAA